MAKNKIYPIDQSPFYKLSTKAKLADLLRVERNALKELSSGLQYKVWKNEKGRLIQEPYGTLKLVHQRIFQFLRCIEAPDYLHSGVKQRSYVTNAKMHVGRKQLYKIDISKFFPSVEESFISGFYVNSLHCAKDVAWFLQKICTHARCQEKPFEERGLPTGSSISQIIAFYAYKPMFDELFKFSQENNIVMTVYVDDITFSGKNISEAFQHSVKKIIHSRGLVTKRTKERFFRAEENKVVTGVVIVGDDIRVKNFQRIQIYEGIKMLYNMEESLEKKKLRKSIIGRLSSAGLIENGFKRQLELVKSMANFSH